MLGGRGFGRLSRRLTKRKTETSTGKVTEYSWDHRNRLTTVKDRNSSGGSVVKQVDYAYDAFNRLVKRTYDSDGAGAGAATNQFWVYDEGINAVLQFDGPGASDLSHRYLWTDIVDELMADETVGSGADTLYALGDHLGTIRDIANFNESTSVTSVTNRRTYNSFGKLVSETNTAVDLIFGYTGKQLDEATGLQHNLFRWYDSSLGQWLSEDPMGLAAGDENVRRYVGNRSSISSDPSGLQDPLTPEARAALLAWLRTIRTKPVNPGYPPPTILGDNAYKAWMWSLWYTNNKITTAIKTQNKVPIVINQLNPMGGIHDPIGTGLHINIGGEYDHPGYMDYVIPGMTFQQSEMWGYDGVFR